MWKGRELKTDDLGTVSFLGCQIGVMIPKTLSLTLGSFSLKVQCRKQSNLAAWRTAAPLGLVFITYVAVSRRVPAADALTDMAVQYE